MAKLYVVRHGQAATAGDLRLPGPDLPLTEHGRSQVEALARRLRALTPVAIYSSDALRARETGATVADWCAMSPSIRHHLREIDFGAWGGRTYAEIAAEQPSAARYFEDVTCQDPPGGESAELVAGRVLDALQTIAAEHRDGAAVVVGHAGSLRLGLAKALGMRLADYWRLRLDYASLSILDWTERGIIVERWNDVSHLKRNGNHR